MLGSFVAPFFLHLPQLLPPPPPEASRCPTSVWRKSDYGVRLGGRLYTHCLWADNIYLLAPTANILRAMMQSLTYMLFSRGLFWKLSSLGYMTPLENPPVHLALDVPQPGGESFVSAAQPGFRFRAFGSQFSLGRCWLILATV